MHFSVSLSFWFIAKLCDFVPVMVKVPLNWHGKMVSFLGSKQVHHLPRLKIQLKQLMKVPSMQKLQG